MMMMTTIKACVGRRARPCFLRVLPPKYRPRPLIASSFNSGDEDDPHGDDPDDDDDGDDDDDDDAHDDDGGDDHGDGANEDDFSVQNWV